MRRRALIVLLVLAGLAGGGALAWSLLLREALRTRSHGWALIGITADQRGLRIQPAGWGGCEIGPPRVGLVAETDERVEIAASVRERTPRDDDTACSLVARSGPPVTVRLSRPLAGRRITGARREQPIPDGIVSDDRRIVVPRTIGLRRADAVDVLCSRGLRTASVGPRDGVVRAQRPAAGVRMRVPRRHDDRRPSRPCRQVVIPTPVTLTLAPPPG
ncbi:hypothetical protein [Patulibacter defluvii]|uniref:hypothetical protein n=1 Tax=Patulibacter defluvii TaxID=3095358 RepID=UPI002A7508A3|nr:hypothetical protein [Patulibacter sp. DM4]